LPLRFPAATLLLAAVLLMAPTLLLGTHATHSSPQNVLWAAQFADQFRAGILYPRWMPQSFEGLGGPSFYFYAPVVFWVDALVSVLSANLLTISARLALTSTLILWASGLAMHAWLRRVAPGGWAALLGAIGYMAAPYHLLDHYLRGAFAEFTAYALLPLVLLGIRLIADGRRGGPAVLALGYAGLAMSHLPTALLASVTAIPFYVLFRALAPRALLRCAAAGLIGLGVASIYVLPAILLQDWISIEQFYTPFYEAERWLLRSPGLWPDPNTMQSIASFAVAAALATGGSGLMMLRLPASDPNRRELRFWIGTCAVCLLLIAGLVPGFWRIDMMAKVQFPWRLMVVIEFATLTALALVPWQALRLSAVAVFAAAAIALIPGVKLLAIETIDAFAYTRAHLPLEESDMKPYQPRGFPHNPNTGYAETGLEPLARLPTIACTPPARLCRAEDGRFGELTVEIDSDRPTTVVLRRFFFPNWRIENGPAIAATDPYRLVSFVAPAGSHRYRVDRRAVPIERWSWLIAGVSLLALLVWAGVRRR
jgi:hypothetical protein